MSVIVFLLLVGIETLLAIGDNYDFSREDDIIDALYIDSITGCHSGSDRNCYDPFQLPDDGSYDDEYDGYAIERSKRLKKCSPYTTYDHADGCNTCKCPYGNVGNIICTEKPCDLPFSPKKNSLCKVATNLHYKYADGCKDCLCMDGLGKNIYCVRAKCEDGSDDSGQTGDSKHPSNNGKDLPNNAILPPNDVLPNDGTISPNDIVLPPSDGKNQPDDESDSIINDDTNQPIDDSKQSYEDGDPSSEGADSPQEIDLPNDGENIPNGVATCNIWTSTPLLDGCNRCVCTDGIADHIYCTEKTCTGYNGMNGRCDKYTREPHVDGCNTCYCGDGNIRNMICTKKKCSHTRLFIKDPIFGGYLVQGKYCQIMSNVRGPDGCIHCHCVDGIGKNMLCLDKCKNKKKKANKLKKTVLHGKDGSCEIMTSVIAEDGCNRCFCTNGNFKNNMCTNKRCSVGKRYRKKEIFKKGKNTFQL